MAKSRRARQRLPKRPTKDPFATGGHGCLFYPPLTCRNKRIQCKNCVSKLLDAEDFRTEMRENGVIDTIDPHNHFHFPMVDYCDGGTQERTASKCSDYNRIIYYEKGGQTLSDYYQSGVNSGAEAILLLKRLENLFKGISFFRSKHFAHMDIKGPNVVQDQHGNLKFIDFGLSQSYTNFKYDGLYKSIYVFWPPEAMLLALNPSYASGIIPLAINIYAPRYISDDFVASNILYLNPTIGSKQLELLLLRLSIKMQKKELSALDILTKFDVYSLGATLSMIYIGIREHLPIHLRTSIKMLCANMCNFDYDKRITAQEAHQLYKTTILDKIDTT